MMCVIHEAQPPTGDWMPGRGVVFSWGHSTHAQPLGLTTAELKEKRGDVSPFVGVERGRLMMKIDFYTMIMLCNQYLWKYLYPSGQLVFRSLQHRDLVRTFFAGCFELAMVMDDKEMVEGWVAEYEVMSKPNWLPDQRFEPPDNYYAGEMN
jgi:hypothetical protein